MTFQEFKTLLMPLAVQLGAEFDLPTWKLYHRAISDVPIPLLTSAVEDAARTRTKFPSAAQLRELAEAKRQALLRAHPYLGCAACEDHKGWVAVTMGGVEKMERCLCKRAWEAKLTELGVTRDVLALPAAVGDFE